VKGRDSSMQQKSIDEYSSTVNEINGIFSYLKKGG